MEYRIDLYSVFILLGLVQSIFLSFFYFGKEARKITANRYQGVFLLAMAGVVLEILLMYTGYIVQVIHLVDFSEPLALLLGPMIYFIVYSLIHDKGPRRPWPHYVLPLAYLLYNVFLFIQPEAVKYNGYLNAYHPDWPRLETEMIYTDDPLKIREYHSLFTLGSMLLYTLLSYRCFIRYLKGSSMTFWKVKGQPMNRARNYLFIVTIMVGLIFVFKSLYDHDLGDHFIATCVTLLIYYTSFDLIRSSRLLNMVPPSKRYAKSSLSEERKKDLLRKIENALSKGKEHLSIGYALPTLAKEIGVSAHHLSEVINEGFGKSFFDLVAEYRIEEACKLLSEEEGKILKMEEIAEMVGYSSKSSFNTHFKKITGKTPSEYRKGS